MSADDEYDKLEIETVAVMISAERAEQCEDGHFESEENDGDYCDHHSGGCALLIVLFSGAATLFLQIIFSC